MKNIYLDNSATTQVDPQVAEEMVKYMVEKYGNPSSIHLYGQQAKYALDDAREKVAKVINAGIKNIFFTSGGTEADNWAIRGIIEMNIRKNEKAHIVISKYEHSAVFETCRMLEKKYPELITVTYLKPSSLGYITPEQVEDAINNDTKLVSVMHVNNEIGNINDIGSIGKFCRDKGIIFHTDAVQSYSKVPIDVKAMNIDILSASAHKIYGPKGVGMLFVRSKVEIYPLLFGGQQEQGLRNGTENLPGIIGFAKAAEIAQNAYETDIPRIGTLKKKLYELISGSVDNIIVNGDIDKGYNGILNLSFEGVEGESLLLALDLEGVCVSTGSACSAGSVKPSRVLLSIGVSEEMAQSSIRFSIGRFNTMEEIEFAAESVIKAVERLRSMSWM
ncbi:MAG: aminotransferase class V-fold PLP-dependent enzyme [Candidatus Delongbacteria bacterium]|nr:aminotransferase class V-fold PLP-dependent enzyme [Candidatus Delongbacteria bacterium]